MIEISRFRGYDQPIRKLYNEIGRLGWAVQSVDFKSGVYECKVKSPKGRTIVRTGPDPATAVGNCLLYITRAQYGITAAQIKLGMWDHGRWVNQLEPIARAYADAPVYDPKAAGSWMELAHDSDYRAQVLRNQLKIEVVDDPEPYKSAKEMCDDVHNNRHFYVSRANSDHPLWTMEQNVNFRIVHDILGHCFTPEARVRTQRGFIPIVDVVPGDMALSSDGKFHKIRNLWVRPYSGYLKVIDNLVGANPIRVTPEHEISGIVGHHIRSHHKAECSPKCNRGSRHLHEMEWIQASDIQANTYLTTTSLKKDGFDIDTIEIPFKFHGQKNRRGSKAYKLSKEFLWIIGLYLAEGSADKTKINFGLHIDEIEYQQRVIKFFEAHGFKTHFATRPEGNKGVKLEVFGTMLGEWFAEWLGKGCENKAIPAELANLPVDRLKHLIDGVMAGDGHKHTDSIGQTSSILALQINEFALRSGHMASTHSYDKEGKKRTYITSSVFGGIRRGENKRGFWNLQDKLFARNKSVSEEFYEGFVYDLEVEDEHNYIVENILVHNCVSGGDFGWEGENRACAAHFPLLTPNAQQALFTECIAQTGYGAHYRNFGPQKVALLPQFVNPAQEQENDPAHTGIHPSQSLAPTSMPEVQPSPSVGLPTGTEAPHQTGEYGVWSKVAQGLTQDINQNWSSTQQPIPYEQGGNGFEHHGDPLDAFRPGGMMDTASKIDTGWASSAQENGSPDTDKMKQAIVNAFRVVLLSPRKDLRWNAVHYQDISQVPANESDPKVYWDTLEQSRRNWNRSKGYHEDSHMIWYKPLERFRQIIRTKHPDLDHDQAIKLADETFWEWIMEEEHRISAEDQEVPEDKRKTTDEIERRANEAVAQRLKIYNADNDPKNDQISLLSQVSEQGTLIDTPQAQSQDVSRYGAFMGTHLKSIAQISQHVDEILQAALQDVAQGGQGHIFRAKVLSLNISGVGPKVASFAWLLLQPLTSQLATIDVHMMRALNHDYDSEMNPRDYFCFSPETLVRSERGYVPISEIKIGERVLTNEGTFQPVIEIMKREYRGPLVEVKTPIGYCPVRMTPEHPILKLQGLHRRSDHKNDCSPHYCRKSQQNHELIWDSAGSLTNQSYVVSRVFREDRATDLDSIIAPQTSIRAYPINIELSNDALWIIGLYLAEGSASDRCLQFSLHGEETDYQARIIDYFQNELGLRVAYAPERDNWNGVQLLVHNATLARFFSEWLGRGCQNKIIPSELVNLPLERLRYVINGILAGDGCERFETFAQSSPILALQVAEFMLRDNELPSISKFTHKDHRHSDTFTINHKSRKVHKNKRGFWNWQNEKLVRTKVTSSEYSGFVYNLSVAGDHTYVVQNMVVHNCFERELAARRDASGYGSVPLGAFQWGTWDAQRSGMGSHQDHSAMKVLDPVSHDQIDWAGHGAHTEGPILQDQPWWQATQPAADTVAREWDENVAPHFPQNQIPMLPTDSIQKAAGWKLSDSTFTGMIPWFTHPQTGEQIRGNAGETIMQHARNQFDWSTPMVWAMINEAGKNTSSTD